MAVLKASESARIYQLQKWLGLNESPDGDTGLKDGEAAAMRNFRITGEGHLQIRPGYAPVCTLSEDGAAVDGLWHGYVAGTERLLAACGGHLWDLNPGTWEKTDLGAISGAGKVHFFGFENKLYLLTGSQYYCWDGEGQVRAVEGYAPIVVTAAPPQGGGTLLERVNLLTGIKRGEYSPDGESATFQLPENGLDEVLSVEGTELTWSADLEKGTITFSEAPPEGVNTLTFTWRKGTGEREKITAMRFSELYNGASDARVFLYGDGSHQAVYSGLDENGAPTAEYFPDLNVMAVGDANTPITAMIRHFDRLLVFKADSAYAAQYDTMELSGAAVTAAFYCTPLNREIGCSAPGQAVLVENDPRTLFGRGVYEWSLAYGAGRDERSAKRISQRVENTLAAFDLSQTVAFDDEESQEYYVLYGEKALVHNYAVDAWYCYDCFPAACMARAGGELYFGTRDGRVMHFSRNYRNDDLSEIEARWESGSLDFDRLWQRKHTVELWLSLKPEGQGRITVTAQSNRKSDYVSRDVAAGLSTFRNVSFEHWSFGTNRKPQVRRVRWKVKGAAFTKLVFTSRSASATATILAAGLKIRYSGSVK